MFGMDGAITSGCGTACQLCEPLSGLESFEPKSARSSNAEKFCQTQPSYCTCFVEGDTLLPGPQPKRTGLLPRSSGYNKHGTGLREAAKLGWFTFQLRPRIGMVALWWLLVDEEEKPRDQFDLRIVWLAVGMVGVILIGAGLIALVERWRKRPFLARMTASEQLAQFRELFDKGQIQPEE